MKTFWIFFMVATLAVQAIARETAVKPAQQLTRGQSANSPLDNSGGPDAAGYLYVDNVAGDTASFNWIELCGDGFAENGPFGDDVTAEVGWNWNFPFYGSMYTSAFISTNGMIQFGTANIQSSSACPYASGTPAGPQIAPYWDDLWCITIGGCNNNGQGPWVRYRDFGTQLVVEWSRVTHFGQTTDRFSFEAILYPSGRIKFQYNTNWNDGATPNQGTIGIDAPGEGNGVEYRCDGSGNDQITGGRAIWFYHPTGAIAGVIQDADDAPIPGANVRINELGITFTTGNDGLYSFGNVPVDMYSVTACAMLYENQTHDQIAVISGQTVISNFSLPHPTSHTLTSSDGPFVIPGLQTVSSHVNVLDNFVVSHVWVRIDSILYDLDSDLTLALISPLGTSVTLSSGNGRGDNNYVNTLFDDCAECLIGTPACNAGPFTGEFRPEESLAAFNGESSFGQWTLNISTSVDVTGTFHQWTLFLLEQSDAGIGEQSGVTLPSAFALLPNYPNPFNPETKLGFSLHRAAQISLMVYDVTGRLVSELASGRFDAGEHAVTFNGASLPSGIYFAQLSAGGFQATQKMVLLK
jgi:subtilisin-like proprotein convertase family protein